ncbi:ATP-grasp domain-containing protein [Methanolobus sp. ZRKC2]|uniref:ATP-grasp domain-containing protein n=1 Tax=Methanolobus sp. ZRKC2 TaxID=3125783 RepID=UPI00324D67EF
MDEIIVLVTSAGVSSAINIIKSLKLQNEFKISIIATDLDELAPGLHLADHSYISPPISKTEEYLNFIYEICEKHNVSVLYPCYSKELAIISRAKDDFNRLGVKVLLSSPDVIDLCNDKMSASMKVEELGIPVPKIILNPNKFNLPLFSKPLEGSSSEGATYVDNYLKLHYLLNSTEKRIYQEYVSGDEYTIDVLCSNDSDVLFSGPRKRISTKSGQSVKGITINNDRLDDYVNSICKSFGVVGVCNIQFIEREEEFYFIEINPRYAAGGLMLTVKAGANLPLAALKLMLGFNIDKSELVHKPNIAMTRYWEEIIVEDLHED